MHIQRHNNKKVFITKSNLRPHCGKYQNKVFIPKSKEKPFYEPGDEVGFVGFDRSGIVRCYKYRKSGELVYVVSYGSKGFFSYETEHRVWELYLKPLTRKVLVEKSNEFHYKNRIIDKIILSGTTASVGFSFPAAIRLW